MNPRLTSLASLLVLSLVFPACAKKAPIHDSTPAATPSQRPAVVPGSAVATVGGALITTAEIEQALRIPLYDLEMEKYRVIRRRLEQMLVDRLLEGAAAARGLAVQAYITAEIQEKIAVTQEEVDALYAQKRDQLPADEARAKQDIRNILARDRANRAVQGLVDRLVQEEKVDIILRPPEPPVVTLSAGDDPALGPSTAPVTIVEFADFQCPVCKDSLPVLKRLRTTYPDQLRLIYRDLPIPSHPQARPAAEAAQCAYEQGQFWQYHDALFAQTPELKPSDYVKLAETLKLNTDDFAACLGSARAKAAVARDVAEAQRLGLNATPTFFVNGRYLAGLQTFETFREWIDRELAAARNGPHPSPAPPASKP